MGNEAPVAGQTIDLTAHPPLFSGESITSAAAGTDQTGQRTVDFTLSSAARDLFATYTANHIGEYFAITVDGIVITAPVITSSIANGQVEITSPGVGGWDPAAQLQVIALLASGAMPQPLTLLSAEPVVAPADVTTPAPSTPAPSASSAPSEPATPTPSIALTGNLVTDACLAGNHPVLPDGFVPDVPILQQDDTANGVGMFVLPVKGDPAVVWMLACRYQWLADGTVEALNTTGAMAAARITAPATIVEVATGTPISTEQLIVGQATGNAKRVVAVFADGSTVEAARSGDYWMAWTRTKPSLQRVVAYDASGKEIWSGTWPSQ